MTAVENLKTCFYVADFETTVYEGQQSTDVWAAAVVELNTEDVVLLRSIRGFMNYIETLCDARKSNLVVYFHNLKFDGSFILYYLLGNRKYHQALTDDGKEFKPFKAMRHREYRYLISQKGVWYSITLKYHNKRIEFRDSAKLLPFSVKQIGESFGTKHHKLSMDYAGYREPEGPITPDEERYIKNDVLVVKEALEIMFEEGNNKLTIGACCLARFKALYSREAYKELFPDIYKISLPPEYEPFKTAGHFILRGYHGAWCYLVKGKEGKVYRNGCTFDVNSLYPYVMHSASGFEYPYGLPKFWRGDCIPDEALQPHKYYYVWVKTRFKLKPDKLPTIQIKGSMMYPPKEWLETSDVYYNGQYWSSYRDSETGRTVEARPEFVMTMWDWQLMQAHYDLEDTQILGGCYFDSVAGLFDEYIDYYKEIKIHSKGAKRTEAKLFSNNLYGKMAASTDSSFRIGRIDPAEGVIKYEDIDEDRKTPGYIPIGAAITSHARYYTITHAQVNYHGPDKPGFIYADTDSLHGDMPAEDWFNVEYSPTEYGKWKCEAEWDEATFVMAKTYIEHVIRSDGAKVRPHYSVTAAGMPRECKEYLQRSMDGIKVAKREKATMAKDVRQFINTPRTIADFKKGLVIPGALKAVNFPGGILLQARDHTIR